MAGFRVRQDKPEEPARELYLENGDDGEVHLKIADDNDGWYLLTINADGTLSRAGRVPDNVGVQVERGEKIVIRK